MTIDWLLICLINVPCSSLLNLTGQPYLGYLLAVTVFFYFRVMGAAETFIALIAAKVFFVLNRFQDMRLNCLISVQTVPFHFMIRIFFTLLTAAMNWEIFQNISCDES